MSDTTHDVGVLVEMARAADSVLEAIAVEAQRRVDVLTAPAPEARPTTVEKMAYTAGTIDGHCGCAHKYTGQIGVSTGDEGPTT